jgi:hypothetical protein
MTVLVSLQSGAAAEAAIFGVPALFLDCDALGAFPGLVARGQAQIIDHAQTISRIADMPARPVRDGSWSPPSIQKTLARLDEMADDFGRLCAANPLGGSRRA